MQFLSLAVSLLLSAGVLALPSSEPRQTLAQVIRSCTKPNTVALTFDDGPYIYLQNISATLTANGVKGTFFFNGNNWNCIYAPQNVENIKLAYSQGHQIASHTWAHKNLSSLTFDQIHNEFWKVEQALQRIVGVTPAFARPPYGAYNNLVRQVSAQRGQKLALWDFDSGDTTGATPAQSKQMYKDAAAKHPSNILSLMHEIKEATAYDVLPFAITVLKQAGYKLVTLADCLGVQPYQKIAAPQTGVWTC